MPTDSQACRPAPPPAPSTELGWGRGRSLRPLLTASWPLGDLEPALAPNLVQKPRAWGGLSESTGGGGVCLLEDPSKPSITSPSGAGGVSTFLLRAEGALGGRWGQRCVLGTFSLCALCPAQTSPRGLRRAGLYLSGDQHVATCPAGRASPRKSRTHGDWQEGDRDPVSPSPHGTELQCVQGPVAQIARWSSCGPGRPVATGRGHPSQLHTRGQVPGHGALSHMRGLPGLSLLEPPRQLTAGDRHRKRAPDPPPAGFPHP